MVWLLPCGCVYSSTSRNNFWKYSPDVFTGAWRHVVSIRSSALENITFLNDFIRSLMFHIFIFLQTEQTFSLLYRFISRGTQIWKWCTSAYRKTKVGGIRCKISSKKRESFGVGTKKRGGSFWFGLPKMGVTQCTKMQFQVKDCKFYVKIATEVIIF